MNDFLQSIRNNAKDKRYNKNRRSYDGNQYNYNSNDNRRNGNERRPRTYRGNNAGNSADMMQNSSLDEIKTLLEGMVQNQRRSLEIEDRRADAEERKADALEVIASYLKCFTGSFSPDDVENRDEAVFEEQSVLSDEQELDASCKTRENVSAEPVRRRRKEKSPAVLSRDEVIRMIFEMRDSGATYGQIAEYLVEKNIPTFSGRGEWHAQTIHRLFQKK